MILDVKLARHCSYRTPDIHDAPLKSDMCARESQHIGESTAVAQSFKKIPGPEKVQHFRAREAMISSSWARENLIIGHHGQIIIGYRSEQEHGSRADRQIHLYVVRVFSHGVYDCETEYLSISLAL